MKANAIVAQRQSAGFPIRMSWVRAPSIAPMKSVDDKRRIALLEATLREIIRIDKEAETDQFGSMSMETSLDGQLLKQWRNIKRKAEHLLKDP